MNQTDTSAETVERLGDVICGLLTAASGDKSSIAWRMEASATLSSADTTLRALLAERDASLDEMIALGEWAKKKKDELNNAPNKQTKVAGTDCSSNHE